MSGCIELLDEALKLGEQELVFLAEGDVESAESAASDRAGLIDAASKDFAVQDAAILRERLGRLLEMQKRATAEATALREDVRKRLGRTKKEVRRMAGYKGASKPAPRILNRYLNKQG